MARLIQITVFLILVVTHCLGYGLLDYLRNANQPPPRSSLHLDFGNSRQNEDRSAVDPGARNPYSLLNYYFNRQPWYGGAATNTIAPTTTTIPTTTTTTLGPNDPRSFGNGGQNNVQNFLNTYFFGRPSLFAAARNQGRSLDSGTTHKPGSFQFQAPRANPTAPTSQSTTPVITSTTISSTDPVIRDTTTMLPSPTTTTESPVPTTQSLPSTDGRGAEEEEDREGKTTATTRNPSDDLEKENMLTTPIVHNKPFYNVSESWFHPTPTTEAPDSYDNSVDNTTERIPNEALNQTVSENSVSSTTTSSSKPTVPSFVIPNGGRRQQGNENKTNEEVSENVPNQGTSLEQRNGDLEVENVTETDDNNNNNINNENGYYEIIDESDDTTTPPSSLTTRNQDSTSTASDNNNNNNDEHIKSEDKFHFSSPDTFNFKGLSCDIPRLFAPCDYYKNCFQEVQSSCALRHFFLGDDVRRLCPVIDAIKIKNPKLTGYLQSVQQCINDDLRTILEYPTCDDITRVLTASLLERSETNCLYQAGAFCDIIADREAIIGLTELFTGMSRRDTFKTGLLANLGEMSFYCPATISAQFLSTMMTLVEPED